MNDQPRTFDDESAFGCDKWVSARLGRGVSWLQAKRPMLEREGFPPKDRLVGLTLKADVDAWLARRRRVADAVEAHTTGDTTISKENLHVL